ncbi:MAG: hypothetical protein GWN67_17645 [Phycisphaerae bacterium]|nr:hypothetical protein [Phycisphaerae bacterium]NIP52926.1 hypothetical protein [Phycisphaerae bacterium]NIS51977.1 hypothetical protein [Phycisphaerae bacterium]NIU09491.1 hypothetical protein [Phycisphaerae bacterium]NIU58142.1 hypothetical protein [Phycisphaerae bacterium]
MKAKYINIMLSIIWRYLFGIALAFLVLAQSGPRRVRGEIRKIDPYGPGTRFIQDIETGGIETISGDEIIDIIIIGDGYTCPGASTCEDTRFFNDAQVWYDNLFDSVDGIRPYSLFRQAFRVHAVFEPSADHASPDRESYFRVNVSCNPAADNPDRACSISLSGWQRDGTDPNNILFRNRLFDAIDDVDAFTSGSLNLTKYPDDMGEFDGLEGLYRNLVIAFLVRGYRNIPKTIVGHLSGFASTVESMTGSPPDKVRVGFGRGWEHEFGHAFALLKDEYIGDNKRGTTSSGTNPVPSERSVFNLSNLTYSNARCDLLWPHIAPGGRYNPNVRSLIGNLFKGGNNEHGVWHSEYQCLINGGHHNYLCDNDDPGSDYYDLRDHEHYCFWCEEIVAIRILEKARQIGTETPSVAMGKTWLDRWETTLRHDYYTHFDIPALIEEKDACYALFSGGSCPTGYPDCEITCDLAYRNDISCLGECLIREVGNAMYVDSGAGGGADGSRERPYDDIITAISESHIACVDPHLIIVKPAIYPGPLTLDTPAVLIAEGCSSVVIGN